MENSYLTTFVTGFSEVIKNNLTNHIKIFKIDQLLDGLIVYNSSTNIEQIKKINYINNTFLILKKFENSDKRTVNSMLKDVLRDNRVFGLVYKNIKRRSSFRLIVSKENQFISANKGLLQRLEDKLSKNKKLYPNRLLPDYEFWLLLRSEGVAYFCIRLTKKANQEKNLEKGELRPELAGLMCLISEPQDRDVFMDPFCGHGAIPIQRLFIPNVKYQEIIASDIDKKLVNKLKQKIKQLQKKKSVKRFAIKDFDALNMISMPNGVAKKIVTDPPWGLRASQIDDIENFQNQFLKEMHRVLSKDGLLVILAKKEIFDRAIKKHLDKFQLLKEYTTLVSGQKASVYKFRKV